MAPTAAITPSHKLQVNERDNCVTLRVVLPKVPVKTLNLEVKPGSIHVDSLRFSRKFVLDVAAPDHVVLDDSHDDAVDAQFERGILLVTVPIRKNSKDAASTVDRALSRKRVREPKSHAVVTSEADQLQIATEMSQRSVQITRGVLGRSTAITRQVIKELRTCSKLALRQLRKGELTVDDVEQKLLAELRQRIEDSSSIPATLRKKWRKPRRDKVGRTEFASEAFQLDAIEHAQEQGHKRQKRMHDREARDKELAAEREKKQRDKKLRKVLQKARVIDENRAVKEKQTAERPRTTKRRVFLLWETMIGVWEQFLESCCIPSIAMP